MKHWREYEYPDAFERYYVIRRGRHIKKVPIETPSCEGVDTREVLGLYWVLEKSRASGWDVLRGEPIAKAKKR
jgi:hypothetical protein